MQTLVADDDPMMRALIGAALEQRGHRVSYAEDGTIALQRIVSERPALIVLDWQMPQADGLTVLHQVRADAVSRSAFVLMVTAQDGEAALMRSLDAGADDYLSKPFTADALQSRLVIAERRIATQSDHRAAEEALRSARYLAGMAETVVAVQHEINNPLAALLGHTQLLQLGLVPPSERDGVLAEVAAQALRIGEVVSRLGAIARPRSVEYANGIRMLDLSASDTETQ
jgi:DNA-binding response OmpR family regulator